MKNLARIIIFLMPVVVGTACFNDQEQVALEEVEQHAAYYCNSPSNEICYNQFEAEFGVRWTQYCCYVTDFGLFLGCWTNHGICRVSDWPATEPNPE